MSRMTLISKNESIYAPNQVQLQFGPNPTVAPTDPASAPASNASFTVSSSEAASLVVGKDYDVTITSVG